MDKKGLAGRDLDSSGSIKKDNLWYERGTRIIPWILGLCLMPYFLYSSGIHFILAKYLGDKTISDEGIDARCSYHLVIIATGYLVFSPILAIILESIIYYNGFIVYNYNVLI